MCVEDEFLAEELSEKYLTEAEKKLFDAKALMVWIENSAWKAVDAEEAAEGEVVPARFLQRWKRTSDGPQANARVIIQGFKRKDVLEKQLDTESPTLTRIGRIWWRCRALEAFQRRRQKRLHAGWLLRCRHQDLRQTDEWHEAQVGTFDGLEGSPDPESYFRGCEGASTVVWDGWWGHDPQLDLLQPSLGSVRLFECEGSHCWSWQLPSLRGQRQDLGHRWSSWVTRGWLHRCWWERLQCQRSGRRVWWVFQDFSGLSLWTFETFPFRLLVIRQPNRLLWCPWSRALILIQSKSPWPSMSRRSSPLPSLNIAKRWATSHALKVNKGVCGQLWERWHGQQTNVSHKSLPRVVFFKLQCRAQRWWTSSKPTRACVFSKRWPQTSNFKSIGMVKPVNSGSGFTRRQHGPSDQTPRAKVGTWWYLVLVATKSEIDEGKAMKLSIVDWSSKKLARVCRS